MRDSPAIKIVFRLLALGARVNCHDPAVLQVPALIGAASFFGTAGDSCEGAELLVVLTEWPQFAKVQASLIAVKMTSLRVFDCRNILDRYQWENAGFNLLSLGREK